MTTAISPLHNKRIVLGVTGSVAAYKTVELASMLAQSGAQVDVIMTEAATRFVTPLTFASVTGRKVFTDADLWSGQHHVLHVHLADEAGAVVIAPATANTINKISHGFADNLLTLTTLASSKPLVIAPAMDSGLFENPATQKSLETFRKRKALIIGPEWGHLASGARAIGRMSEPAKIAAEIRHLLSRQGRLRGKTILVTAGPTQEPIDPVRFIANRSSGKQGFALVQAALDEGADVTLIAGPVNLPTPKGARRIDVKTAKDMAQAVLKECPKADALLMTAAVADFTPVKTHAKKLKKNGKPAGLVLEATTDILKEAAKSKKLRGKPKIIVGFAAETDHLTQNAKEKLRDKGLSLIAANNVTEPGAGFGSDTNKVTLITADGHCETLPLMGKDEVGRRIIERIMPLLSK